jgi:hypothetical protein
MTQRGDVTLSGRLLAAPVLTQTAVLALCGGRS